jgi:hypothetical protein
MCGDPKHKGICIAPFYPKTREVITTMIISINTFKERENNNNDDDDYAV